MPVVTKLALPTAAWWPALLGSLLLLVGSSTLLAQKKPPALFPKDGPKLSELAQQAEKERFKLPTWDEGKVTAAGIRKIESEHLTILTDLPESAEIDALPKVFEAALPLWEAYFGWPKGKLKDWKVVGCLMKEKERFVGSELLPDNLPDFPNGYARGSQFWWYDQPSDYYRRHLMLHEGTHMVMDRFLGGMGPIWYMEGIAELVGTHRWENNKLQLAIMPMTREEVPYWGRVKMIRDGFAEQKAYTLGNIFRINPNEHFKPEMYGWAWGAATFLSQHPQTKEPFSKLYLNAADRSIDFSLHFEKQIAAQLPQIEEDWQVFVADCDYGYDVPRAAILRKPAKALPAAGETVEIQADHGWQSSGLQVQAEQEVSVQAKGRYTLRNAKDNNASGGKNGDWPCEPGGITIRYQQGWPIGALLVAVGDVPPGTANVTPLAKPQMIGLGGKLRSPHAGTLYFRINEAASGLSDNAGQLQVTIKPTKP